MERLGISEEGFRSLVSDVKAKLKVVGSCYG